jgi:methionyl-tRNA formyltransferase
MRALVLSYPDTLSAGILWGWISDGHSVCAMHCCVVSAQRARASDRLAGAVHERLSLQELSSKAKCAIHWHELGGDWDDILGDVHRLEPDVVLSVMFLRRVPERFLRACPCPVLNLHPALLPDYRGRTPLHSMFLDGREKDCSGLTLHVVDQEFDTGPIIARRALPEKWFVGPASYHSGLIETGRALLVEGTSGFLAGTLVPVSQRQTSSDLRCAAAGKLDILPTDTGEDAKRKLVNLGRFDRVRISLPAQREAVGLPLRKVAAATGDPPRISFFHIEADLADGRYRFRRLGKFFLRLSKARFLKTLARQHENALRLSEGTQG